MPIHITVNSKKFKILSADHFGEQEKPAFYCWHPEQGRGHIHLERATTNNNFGFDNREDVFSVWNAFYNDDKETLAYFALKYG